MTNKPILSRHSCARRRESMTQFASEYHRAARGPNAHLPCSRVVTGVCCGLACPHVVQLLGLKALHPGWPSPWPDFFGGWDGCTAAGSSTNTMGAISEILAPRSRAWHRHASCLLICKNAPGWLACQLANLQVGVFGWYFADRCSLILCGDLADTQSGASCKVGCALC